MGEGEGKGTAFPFKGLTWILHTSHAIVPLAKTKSHGRIAREAESLFLAVLCPTKFESSITIEGKNDDLTPLLFIF